MRKLLGLIVLVFVAVLAIAQFGPSALLGEETTRQDSRPVPEFSGISAWLNSPPLTTEGLRGKVVLVQFWTYSCINCLRTLPYVTKWHEQYKDKGLVVVGVHTPEFAFEKERANVETAIKRLGIHYPVAQDNQYRTWRAFGNQYWPAAYLIDRSGTIVATQFGEGGYQQMENAIARLVGDRAPVAPTRDPDLSAVATPEMYLGSEKNDGAIVETQDAGRGERTYALPDNVPPNRFALSGALERDGRSRHLVGRRRRNPAPFQCAQGQSGRRQPVAANIVRDRRRNAAAAGHCRWKQALFPLQRRQWRARVAAESAQGRPERLQLYVRLSDRARRNS